MVDAELTTRRSGRVLMINRADEVLLFRGCDPRNPEVKYWFSVGGGVDEGEDATTAAVREVREETGVEVDARRLVGPVYTESVEFPFDGRVIRQHQVFFVLRVDDPVIDTSGFEDYEVDTMDRHKWWSVEQLRRTAERYYPQNLVSLMDEILCQPR